MDRELLEYFEGKFGHFEGRFNQLEGRFDHLEGRFDHLEGKVDQFEGRFESFREEANQRFDRLEGEIRQSHVLIEDVRSDVKGVAEGVVAGREELAAHRRESTREREEDKALLISLFRHGQQSLEAREERLDKHETRLTHLESARL